MDRPEASPSCRDVVLSFRGSSKFPDQLLTALVERGIHAFKDDPELKRGSEISTAVCDSRVSVVLLSEKYANSTWCLEELACILKHKLDVMPIFYGVDPSDVRNQTGRLAAQFKIFEDKYKDEPEKVIRWKAALTEVANLSGWNSKGRCESDLIKDIVKDVWQKLHPGLPFHSPSQLAVNKIGSTRYSSSSSSSHQKKKCDVFISFRGKDTRSNFFSHLYNALVDYGISTYRDDIHLERGKSIPSELVKAINEARICLVIFSPNFASSTWCLDELSQILQKRNRVSVVRNGTLESFGEHEDVCLSNREKVEKLMPTLRHAAMFNRGASCQLTKLRLLVNYNGMWTNAGYIGGKTKGILVSEDITYQELEDRVYRIVGVDPREYKMIMKAKYESKDLTQPVEIINDEDLGFFILESLSDERCRIPLCITLEPHKDDPR
ncbi:hypothetical protein ACLB2K_010345 [Fragaria x ananassa]